MGQPDVEAPPPYPASLQRIRRSPLRLPPADEVFGWSIYVFVHCAVVAIGVVYLLASLLPFSSISFHIYQQTAGLLCYFIFLMLGFCGLVAFIDFVLLSTGCAWVERSTLRTMITFVLLTALVWWPFPAEYGLKTRQWNDPCPGFNQTITLQGQSNTASAALFPDGTTMTLYQSNGNSIYGFSDALNETVITYNFRILTYNIAHGDQSMSGPFTWYPTLSFPGMQLFSQRNTWLTDLTPVVALARNGRVLVRTGPIPYGWTTKSEMFVCASDTNTDETKTAVGMILYGLADSLQVQSTNQYYGGK